MISLIYPLFTLDFLITASLNKVPCFEARVSFMYCFVSSNTLVNHVSFLKFLSLNAFISSYNISHVYPIYSSLQHHLHISSFDRYIGNLLKLYRRISHPCLSLGLLKHPEFETTTFLAFQRISHQRAWKCGFAGVDLFRIFHCAL